MQHVYTARDEMDANFVQGLLKQQGIQAVVQGQSLGRGHEAGGQTGPTRRSQVE